MNMQFVNTPSTASAHGHVWGDFPISCMIQENGHNRPFKGSVEWTAHPQTPGVNANDDEGAKASVMKEIQKAWSGLVSYSLPPTNGDSP